VEPMTGWQARAEGWFAQDLALLTLEDGWLPVAAPAGVDIWRRSMPDDPNDLFRWRLPVVGAPAGVVFESFVHRILEHHKAWTKEFVGWRVVAEGPGWRVLHQRFDPGVPGITPRDLCSLELVRELAPGRLLVTYRSVDAMPAEPGFERIDWWGAALCTTLPGGTTSEILYLDRENQGGWFPSWLMNRMMPRYLVLQAEAVRAFFTADRPA